MQPRFKNWDVHPSSLFSFPFFSAHLLKPAKESGERRARPPNATVSLHITKVKNRPLVSGGMRCCRWPEYTGKNNLECSLEANYKSRGKPKCRVLDNSTWNNLGCLNTHDTYSGWLTRSDYRVWLAGKVLFLLLSVCVSLCVCPQNNKLKLPSRCLLVFSVCTVIGLFCRSCSFVVL